MPRRREVDPQGAGGVQRLGGSHRLRTEVNSDPAGPSADQLRQLQVGRVGQFVRDDGRVQGAACRGRVPGQTPARLHGAVPEEHVADRMVDSPAALLGGQSHVRLAETLHEGGQSTSAGGIALDEGLVDGRHR